jgi:predicted dehydrogenase
MHRVLIVGGGSIGERHLRSFLKTGRAEVSVCDNRTERIEQLAAAYPIKATYQDFDTIDYSNFTAAVVCVPANYHVPWSQRLADADLHVFCEKPLSVNVDGVDALERTAQQKKLTVGVAHVRRAMELSRVTKAELDGAKIGQALSLVWYCGYDHRVARPDYLNTYAVRRDMGAGAILDISSHMVNAAQYFIGPVKSVMASFDHLQIEGTDAEDTLSLLLRFQNSPVIANLHCVMWQAHRCDLASFACVNGSIIADGWEGRVGTLIRGTDKWTWVEGLKGKPEDSRGQVDAPFVAEANNFLDAIEGKAKLLCSLAEARHTIEICMAAFESGRTGRVTSVPVGEDLLDG